MLDWLFDLLEPVDDEVIPGPAFLRGTDHEEDRVDLIEGRHR